MPRHNKHTEVTAASHRRIAKDLRAEARGFDVISKDAKKHGQLIVCDFYHFRALGMRDVAKAMDAEAKRLRAMR